MPPFNGNYAAFIAALLKGEIKACRLHATTYEDPDMIAVGGIYTTTSTTDPGLPQAAGGLGYGAWQRFGNGRVLVGIDELDLELDAPGALVGGKTATPTGAVSAPLFTGSAVASQSVSAGTPAGANSAPTFTGAALAAHSHQLPLTGIGGTTPRTTASFGTSGGTVAGVRSLTNAASTTAVARELTQSITAGTPAGTVSAPTFTGSALAAHAHSVTAAGLVSAPAFTGAALSVMQPSIAVYRWRRVS